ncbi:MAG TPA: hypothetical protein VE007_08505 [Thermoanaerobaculia bacterium]|nr:hypothetical protein [Thermoanaerobaculia bacterium]
MTRQRAPLVSSALFVFYCTAVGVYLVLNPWLRRSTFGLGSSGFFRGFVSGLGLVHLFAAAADLRFLSRAIDGGRQEPDRTEGAAP